MMVGIKGSANHQAFLLDRPVRSPIYSIYAQQPEEKMNKAALSGLRAVIDARDGIQKTRIQLSNRLAAIESGRDTADSLSLSALQEAHKRFQLNEAEMDKYIAEIGKEFEIVAMACNVKGIGTLLISRIVGMIDIEIADTVSSLWKYAGYAVDENGEGQRRRRGQKSTFNAALKTACYRLAVSFIKTNSPYREIYDKAKEEYLSREWTKIHAHTAALRKMTKVFLQHLWITWRTLEGLPVSKPYVHDVGGHTHYITPQEMGWPPTSL